MVSKPAFWAIDPPLSPRIYRFPARTAHRTGNRQQGTAERLFQRSCRVGSGRLGIRDRIQTPQSTLFSFSQVDGRSSGSTRVSPVTVMKLVSLSAYFNAHAGSGAVASEYE